MKTPNAVLPLVLSLAGALALGGCSTALGPEDAAVPEQAAARELTRADAIASARKDASHSYGDGWGAQADALRQGGFWVVQLHAKTGYTLRYAISARDGSIRERAMVQ